MPSSNSAKRKFIAMVSVLSLLLISIVLWSIVAYRQHDASPKELSLQLIILLLILAFIVPLLIRMRRDIKLGLPIEDERSKRITVLAGYYAFLVSIYVWLGIMSFEEYFTVSSACAAAILGSSVTFGLAYVILGRKPKIG